jgi:Fur family peroxide stress response transcriptional regulator
MGLDNKLVDIFRSNGFKATHQRIVITQTVLRSKNHPTAEEVFEQVQQIYPTLSLSTVYNTLNILKQMNLVNELAFNDTSRFDPNVRPHINLVCETCGKIVDVEDKNLEKVINRVSEEKGFSVSSHRIELFGQCKSCAREHK